MNGAAAFADAVAARFDAVSSQVAFGSQDIAIGGLRVRLHAPCGRGEPWIGNAFLGRQDEAPARCDEDFALGVWDGTTADRMPPPRPWSEDAHVPLGLIRGYCDDETRCAWDIHTASLIVSCARRRASYVWLPSLRGLPAWALASPCRIPLSWFANTRRMQVVHAAATARGGRAVLLVGEGGSGKSTTVLTCAVAGLDYLGDDYCVVEPDAGKVHLLYRTAKLFPNSLEILPELRALLVNPDLIFEEKGVMFFRDEDLALRASAQVAAIALPRVSARKRTTVSRASSAEALRAILPTTVGGLMGGTPATPGLLMKLVLDVPAYHLDVGIDRNLVVAAVSSLLE